MIGSYEGGTSDNESYEYDHNKYQQSSEDYIAETEDAKYAQVSADSGFGQKYKHRRDEDDFEYNMSDDSDDEIYSISSEDEGLDHRKIAGIKPSVQTVTKTSSPYNRETTSPPGKTSLGANMTTFDSRLPTQTNSSNDSIEETKTPKYTFYTRKYSKPEVDEDVKSLTSSRTESEVSDDSNKKSTFDYLRQKQEQLLKLNQQINVETKQVLKETDNIVKQQSKKVEEIASRPVRPSSSRSNTPSAVSHRSTPVSTPTRPSSASQSSARKKVQEKIEELDQYQDDDLDRAANEMGLEAAMKFYKARVKALQKDVSEYTSQIKQKDEKIKELDIKYNATLVENKKVVKNESQYQSRLDRQRKEFDALQLKFKKQTSTINEMQKDIDKLRQNQRVEPNSNPSNEASPQGGDRLKDIKYTRAIEEIEKLKTQLSEVHKQQREDSDKQRKDAENLRKENKRLERQKQDIVLAFKKQMKLIDVLKRQIIHLEASKLLTFTEDEFTSLMNQ